MIKKQIFKCGKCHYFPLKIQIQTFLNSQGAFKCPVCSQQKVYGSNEMLLDNQSYVYEVNEKYQQRQTISSLITKTQNNRQSQSHCLIMFQMSSSLYQSFYLNPINPQLMNSFNVNKQVILSSKTHLFFFLNDQVKKELANLPVDQAKKYLRQKKTTRKISKFEHMLYCLDVYLMKLYGQSQEKIIILKVFVKDLTQNQDNHQERSLKIAKELVFKLSIYGKSIQTKEVKEIKEPLNRENTTYELSQDEGQIQNFVNEAKSFIKELYKIQITLTNSNNHIYSNINLTTCSIFAQNYDQQEAKKVLNLVNTHNTNLNKIQNCKIHYFYLQNSSSKCVRQQFGSIQQPKLLKLPQHQIYHSYLFIRYYKGKHNIQSTIQNIIHKPTQKQKSVHSLQQKKQKQLNLPSLLNDQALRQVNLNQHDQKNSCLYIFWKSQVNSKHIKANRIKSKIILEKFEKEVCLKSFSSEINQVISKSKAQIVEMILKHSSVENKFRQNIILDRLECLVKKCQIYFVFDYEQIIKEHFQQLDFIQEHSLPDVLKKYARSYETQKTKSIENHFKKGNNRVYLNIDHIPQFIQTSRFSNSQEDDDRQSL